MIDWSTVTHFKSFEFDSADAPGSGARMDETFVRLLDALRDACGFPLIVLSGFRTPSHNAAVDGEPNSAHLRGLAADLKALTSHDRFIIKREAMKLGVNRIGTGTGFVHLDIDRSLPQEVEWLYPPSLKRTT